MSFFAPPLHGFSSFSRLSTILYILSRYIEKGESPRPLTQRRMIPRKMEEVIIFPWECKILSFSAFTKNTRRIYFMVNSITIFDTTIVFLLVCFEIENMFGLESFFFER